MPEGNALLLLTESKVSKVLDHPPLTFNGYLIWTEVHELISDDASDSNRWELFIVIVHLWKILFKTACYQWMESLRYDIKVKRQKH